MSKFTIKNCCRISYKSDPAALREKHAPPADLIRISVGIEDVNDLIEDLENAFSAAAMENKSQARAVLSAE